jgi:hypothetical protein
MRCPAEDGSAMRRAKPLPVYGFGPPDQIGLPLASLTVIVTPQIRYLVACASS